MAVLLLQPQVAPRTDECARKGVQSSNENTQTQVEQVECSAEISSRSTNTCRNTNGMCAAGVQLTRSGRFSLKADKSRKHTHSKLKTGNPDSSFSLATCSFQKKKAEIQIEHVT